MGMELEFKLAVKSPALLEQILFDKQIAEIRQGSYRLINMATIYYDTPDRRLQTRMWTLRLRQENSRLVATLKTPGQGRARGEWECDAPTIQAAIPLLIEAGAPAELPQILDHEPLIPVCAAQFSRALRPRPVQPRHMIRKGTFGAFPPLLRLTLLIMRRSVHAPAKNKNRASTFLSSSCAWLNWGLENVYNYFP